MSLTDLSPGDHVIVRDTGVDQDGLIVEMLPAQDSVWVRLKSGYLKVVEAKNVVVVYELLDRKNK
jgi:hypothetical protein